MGLSYTINPLQFAGRGGQILGKPDEISEEMISKRLILAVLAAAGLTGCSCPGDMLNRSEAWHALTGADRDHADSLVNSPGYGGGPQLVPANSSTRKIK